MNVVFILADDLGWADTTLYGHTSLYETPNIERLAARGMTFTRAYSASPLCSPTRASILTGQTPARNGSTAPQHHLKDVRLEAASKATGNPALKASPILSATRLDTKIPTLGKMMKKGGYATGHFGKWHLGPSPYSPLEHGFDVDIPHSNGAGPAGGYVAPWKFKNLKHSYPGEHIEDRMAEEAINWMKTVAGEKPFFLNYWQFSVHGPFDTKKDVYEKYVSKIDSSSEQRSPLYAAMVEILDDAVGNLLDELDRQGIADDTVIIFISDNGGNEYNEIGGVPVTSNDPLRGGKGTIYEGGIRVPCVIVWPGVTKPGSRSDRMIQTTDFYPTLLEEFNIGVPKGYPVDGVNIMPILQGGKNKRTSLVTYYPHSPRVPDWLTPSASIHRGDWKLIRLFHEGENNEHAYRLYNLKEDIGETKDLSASRSKIVQELDAMLDRYFTGINAVLPVPNQNFNSKKYRPQNMGKAKLKKSKVSPAFESAQ